MILRTTIFAEMVKCTLQQIKSENEMDNIDFLTIHETLEKSTTVSSRVWLDFRRILLRESNKVVENYVWCTHCRTATPYYGSTTTRLLEHRKKCTERPQDENDAKPKINFTLDELSGLREAAARFVVKDIQPFYAINGKGLLDLCYESVKLGWRHAQMSKADLAAALPCPNTIKPRVHQMALDGKNCITKKIRHSIAITKRIAATSDLWTEPLNSTSFIALTLHFFVIEMGTLKLESHTVDLREMNELSATGAVIKKTIYDIFLEYGVLEEEVDQFVCMVSDRGSNMLSAFSGLESGVCIIHLLNNVTQQIIKVPEVKEIMGQASALVRYMKTSHAGSQMTSKLKSYPETRFNYAIDMLLSIRENHAEVYNVLRAKEDGNRLLRGLTEKITCLPIDKLEEICDFLKFFKQATITAEGDKKVTLHKVWPILRELWARMQPKESDSDLIAAMKDAALKYIEKPENEHKIALFLHPLMNRLQFLSSRGKSLNFAFRSFLPLPVYAHEFSVLHFSGSCIKKFISIDRRDLQAEIQDQLDAIVLPTPLVTV